MFLFSVVLTTENRTGAAVTVSSKTARDQELTQFFIANYKLMTGFLIAQKSKSSASKLAR